MRNWLKKHRLSSFRLCICLKFWLFINSVVSYILNKNKFETKFLSSFSHLRTFCPKNLAFEVNNIAQMYVLLSDIHIFKHLYLFSFSHCFELFWAPSRLHAFCWQQMMTALWHTLLFSSIKVKQPLCLMIITFKMSLEGNCSGLLILLSGRCCSQVAAYFKSHWKYCVSNTESLKYAFVIIHAKYRPLLT